MNEPDFRAAVGELLTRYGAALDEDERVLSSERTLDVVAAALWLRACRKGSAASVYATERLREALAGVTWREDGEG